MRKPLNIVLFLLLGCFACKPTNPEQVEHYFTETERDTLLTNVITFMYLKPSAATNDTRFEPRFRSYYVSQLPKFRFEKYTISADSTHYYFVIRPAGNMEKYRRGVGGKFKLGKDLMPTDFEEMWCTPRLSEDEVKQRGGYVFKQMVLHGNVDKLLEMRHYIEWPDSTLRYDKQAHEWVMTGKL